MSAASFGNTYGADVAPGDLLRVLPNVPAVAVVKVTPGPRSTTIELASGGKVYCRRGGKVQIDGRP